MRKAKDKRTVKKPATAKEKGKGKAKKAVKGHVGKVLTPEMDTPPPKDLVEARHNIAGLVRESSGEIAQAVIGAAKAGQLAQAKYLFEAVGLYPATGEESSTLEDSLVHRLLKGMGLPTELVTKGDDGLSATGDDVKPKCEEIGARCEGAGDTVK